MRLHELCGSQEVLDIKSRGNSEASFVTVATRAIRNLHVNRKPLTWDRARYEGCWVFTCRIVLIMQHQHQKIEQRDELLAEAVP